MQYTEKLITKDTENLITNEGLFDDQLFRQSAEIVVSKLEKYLAVNLHQLLLSLASINVLSSPVTFGLFIAILLIALSWILGL